MTSKKMLEQNNHKLELLGIGASKDRALKENLLAALDQLDINVPVIEVKDIQKLLEYGISGIPALLVDGKVVFQKIVPSVEDIRIVLKVLLGGQPAASPVKNILVPTDFSDSADNAFRYALNLAETLGANIRLVHIHQAKADLAGRAPGELRELMAQKQNQLDGVGQSGNLTAVKTKSTTESKVQIERQLVRGGVIEELKRLSAQRDTDMIVMGTTGESRFLGKFLGSISSEVARRANCPVLLIPNGTSFKKYEDIVYANNYVPGEEQILPELVNFATSFGADLHFVHVAQDKAVPSQEMPSYVHKGGVQHHSGLKLHLARINHGDVMKGLSNYATESQADLMVLATTQRNFLEEIFHRSVTRRMIFASDIPVLIMHT